MRLIDTLKEYQRNIIVKFIFIDFDWNEIVLLYYVELKKEIMFKTKKDWITFIMYLLFFGVPIFFFLDVNKMHFFDDNGIGYTMFIVLLCVHLAKNELRINELEEKIDKKK